MMARRRACDLVSAASVATTTRLVFWRAAPLVRGSSAPSGRGDGKPRPPNSLFCSNGAAQNHGPPPTTMLPAALATASAATVAPSQVADAEPTPPLRLTVVAPMPAPTLPSAKSWLAAAAAA